MGNYRRAKGKRLLFFLRHVTMFTFIVANTGRKRMGDVTLIDHQPELAINAQNPAKIVKLKPCQRNNRQLYKAPVSKGAFPK